MTDLSVRKLIRRGSFTRSRDLTDKIEAYVQAFNKNPVPFRWTATTESILAKVQRLCEHISGTGDLPQSTLARKVLFTAVPATILMGSGPDR